MPLSKDTTYLRDFMMKYMQYLDLMYGYAGYASEHLNFPEFELTSFEYLTFAEKELGKEDASHRINCVNHLKRAVDCEIDTFLQVLNLYTLIQKRNLK